MHKVSTHVRVFTIIQLRSSIYNLAPSLYMQYRGKTWPEPATHQPTMTSSQRPTSPQRGGGRARPCSESNWYHKVAVCHLECQSKNLSCQCVIIKLSPELRDVLQSGRDAHCSMMLALVAPHTFLYHANPRELREWKMHTGAESVHKSVGMRLHEKYVSHFYTCCGPHGVWNGSKAHTGMYIDEYSCPFQADFIVLVLKKEFADQLKDVLTIPSIPSLNENTFSQALRSGNISLIQRGRSGDSETHKVLLKPPPSLVGTNMSIEDKITAYSETSQIQYTCSYGDVTSPGAGVVYFDPSTPDNALVLAAVHLYSRRDDEVITYCGISLPAIFHAIAGIHISG